MAQRPGAASAEGPTLVAVGHTQHHPTATWSLPSGGVADVIEVATDPSTGSDGSFFLERVEIFDTLDDAQTTFTATSTVAPGTYYVHVGGRQPACSTCPSREWSATMPLAIPTFVSVSVEGRGQVKVGGVSCNQVACPFVDLAPGRVPLRAIPAPGWIVARWSIDSADAPGTTCTIARSTCTVTLTATKGADVSVRFEPKPRTVVAAKVYAYACLREVDVSILAIRPSLDSARPFTGVLTVRLRGPGGTVATRRLREPDGFYPSPEFRRLKAGRYVVTVRYAGDPWRSPKLVQRTVTLGRC